MTDARSYPEGSGDGGQYGDDYVENLAPDFFVVHFLVDSW